MGSVTYRLLCLTQTVVLAIRQGAGECTTTTFGTATLSARRD